MSELRAKIAAGATILALGGLAAVAVTHPQGPAQATQVVASKHAGKQAVVSASHGDDDRSGAQTADD